MSVSSKTKLPDSAYRGGNGSYGATNERFNPAVANREAPTGAFKTQSTEVEAKINDSTLDADFRNSAAADVIFDAYIKRVSKFASYTGAGLDADAVGSLIATSEAYLKSLGNVTEYRKFIGIILVALRANYQTMDSVSARNLIRFIDQYGKSEKSSGDTAIFVKALYAANLLSIGASDDVPKR